MKRLLFIPIFIVVVLFLSNINQTTTLVAKATSDVVPLPVKYVTMRESAVAMGIEFEHARRSYRQNSIADMYGNGACVLDVDNDGFEDIVMVAGLGTTRRYGRDHWWNTEQNSLLYRNQGGLYFEPETLAEDIAISGFGCTVGDLNHDGLDDLVIGDIGQLHLLVNDGKKFNYFSRMLNDRVWPTSLLITDINQDNLNDIVVATLVEYRNDLKVGDQEYGYQGAATIKTSDYAGQNNLVLQALSKDSLTYKHMELVGQQRTLNWLKLNEQQLLAVNAKGSNSMVQGLNHNRHPYDWLTFAATQISPITVADKPYLLIANHSERGIQLLDLKDRLNQAWSVGLTNQIIDASQSWANVISDFNNDGFDDVFIATGFAATALNNPSRPQASPNFLLLQDNLGQFHSGSHQIQPQLSRSSRGAVQGDFNNDGFVDLVVMNNNNFASLYLNQSNGNHWLSIDCQPRQLCLDSRWVLQSENASKTLAYNKVAPYLSHGSSRIHFGLGDESKILSLTVDFADGKQHTFDRIDSDSVYQVNLATYAVNKVENSEPSTAQLSSEQLFTQLLLSENPVAQLSQFDPKQSDELLTILHRYKRGIGKDVSTKNANITAAIGWVLTHHQQFSTKLIDLLIASENRLFVDYMVALLPQLTTKDFCYLSKHLHDWFEQEEVLPETKFSLLAPLLNTGLQQKQKDNENQHLICAIEAVSYSEQTTIGASILPLLTPQQPLIAASAVRAIGRLKYAQGKDELSAFCDALKPQALLLKAECQISLQKLHGQFKKPTQPLKPTATQRFMALHSQSLLFDVSDADLDLAQFSWYQQSPVSDHRFLAYQGLLLQGRYQQLLTKPDVVDFIKQVKSHYPQALDQFVRAALVHYANTNVNSARLIKFISAMSNGGIKPVFEGEIDDQLAMALVKLCQLRQSLKPLCQRRFATDGNLSSLSAQHLVNLPKGQLYYLMAFASKVEKRIIARQLAERRHFDLLHGQGLYRHVGQIELDWGDTWLEDFVRFSFTAQQNIDLHWLEKSASKQQLGSWTRLYLAHIDTQKSKQVQTVWGQND